ncbi:hypothetical protein ILYODFUR_038624 [Ilyodon furcidens]|uniref:Uncharacterized protein n=1 Tax=Ilyodon furcidens TaxID=33524 RepID=A0ABV0SSQ2_9TELE
MTVQQNKNIPSVCVFLCENGFWFDSLVAVQLNPKEAYSANLIEQTQGGRPTRICYETVVLLLHLSLHTGTSWSYCVNKGTMQRHVRYTHTVVPFIVQMESVSE